jgi:hypothetical protein
VRLLHAQGIETCQSCQGGKGHSYEWPTVDLPAGGPSDAMGFGVLPTLVAHGLEPLALSIVWGLDDHGYPHERIWRIEFRRPSPARADEQPMFVWSCQAAAL